MQYAVGNLLGVRPVIAFDDGQLRPVRRARAEQAAQDILAQLRQLMQASGLNIRAGRTQSIGAVIGAHTGPGMYAFVAEPYGE